MLKRLLPKSLLGRSVLIIVTPLILVQVISTWVFYDRHWGDVSRRLSNSLASDVAAILDYMRRHPGAEDRAWILDEARYKLMRATFRPGAVLPNDPAPAPGGRLERVLSRSLAEIVGRPFRIDAASREDQVLIDVQVPDGVLSISASRKRLFSVTTYIFVMWSVGSSLVLFAVATVFMRNQVRPIRRLALAADQFGKGRDVPDFKPAGAAEVRRAARAFLVMRERVKRQVRQRTEMLAGVSHDLRTPLTRMKLQLAMLEDSPEVEELRSNVDEMQGMIDEYLTFARGEGLEATAPTDVADVVADVVEDVRRNGKIVRVDVHGHVEVPVRPGAFKRCITNVIGNAAQYGERVEINVSRRRDHVEITIDDDGPGVPPEKREEVFKAFSRLDASRNPDTGGVGLGLTIARDILRGHGGDIVLDDSPLGGLRARLSLPL